MSKQSCLFSSCCVAYVTWLWRH